VSCRCVSHLPLLMITRYRAFAELLEHGTGSTLILPIHKPASPAPAPAPAPVGLSEQDALRLLGLNPANALQHPGFYYYLAAQATERRREKFLAMLETIGAGETVSPGFANERKVDHFGIIVEVRSLLRIYSISLIAESNIALHQSVRAIQEALATVQRAWSRTIDSAHRGPDCRDILCRRKVRHGRTLL